MSKPGLVTLLASSLWLASPAAARPPRVGVVAPPATFRHADGSTLALADLQGQVVVITFWAAWCVPCRQELPMLDAYYKAQRARGLAMIIVATDRPAGPSPADGLAMPAVQRVRGAYRPLAGVPTTYVIDRGGVLRYAATGAIDRPALDALLAPLL